MAPTLETERLWRSGSDVGDAANLAQIAHALSQAAGGDEVVRAGDQQREAPPADADAIHHPPQFLEIDSTDQPSLARFRCAQTRRHNRGGKQVVVHSEARHQGAFDRNTVGAGNGQCASTEAAGDDGLSGLIEQSHLGELWEVQHEVFQNAVLLPVCQTGVL